MDKDKSLDLKRLSPYWFEQKNWQWWCACVILLLVCATFSRTLHNEFVWDAKSVFVEETRTTSLHEALRFFVEPFMPAPSPEQISELEMSIVSTYYRPLVGLLHYVERTLFGTNPLPYNLINLFGHGLVGIAALFLLRELTGSLFFSLVTTILFVLNPTKTEVVCWSYSDAHILGTLFVLTAFLSFLRNRPTLSTILFVCGLLSIESTILYPALIFLYLVTFGGWKDRQARLYFFMVTAIAVIYFLLRAVIIDLPPMGGGNLVSQLQRAVTALFLFLKIFIWPDAAVTVYHTDDYGARLVSLPMALLASLLILAMLVIAYRYSRWIFFFFGAFLIWISLFLLGGEHEYFASEKGLYFSGLFLTGAGVALLMRYVPVKPLIAAVVIAALLHAGESYARCRYWKDTETYLTKLLDFDRDFFIANLTLGNEYIATRRFHDAKTLYSRLIENYPTRKSYRVALSETYFREALIAVDRQDFSAALVALEKAASITPNRAKVLNNIGNIHLLNKKWTLAIDFYQRALQSDSKSPQTYYNLAVAYKGAGDPGRALYYQTEYERHIKHRTSATNTRN